MNTALRAKVPLLMAALLLLGMVRVQGAYGASPGDPSLPLVERIDRSLGKATRFIVSRQSEDGAWRSDTYGCFKGGPELTPYVLSSLFFLPQGGREAGTAYQKGVAYLMNMVKSDGTIETGPGGLMFPVHTSAMASRVVVLAGRDKAHLMGQAAWLAYLRARRLSGDLGWTPKDSEFGGWGFSLVLPKKPAPGGSRPPFVESNLSATLFGLAALRSARVPESDPIYGEILTFVKRCQNFSDPGEESDEAFDDGGFFFIPADEGQNKAGVAGLDCHGRKRFNSYGSMTADGLRALIRCGLSKDAPRVVAARKWLEWNFSASRNPGRFTAEREELRNSYYYYYLWAAAHAFQALEVKEIATKYGRVRWPEALAEEIMNRQRADGSWISRFTDAKEDDPLVAAPWAASALAICRSMMTGAQGTLFPRQ
ncbi:MAG: prenyltransferase/squalene oxidase repeat-containing protein [Candidatus Eremiobacteraeota bacterium]|nr:prenyltransferase/squalene oxidase repeat-containing protein [Candidatus Eremiobacteraeota bacterium]